MNSYISYYNDNYYNYYNPDYLCHYGVQGMKWGQHLMATFKNTTDNVKNKVDDASKHHKEVKAERTKLMDAYKHDKGPKRYLIFNAANSAARSHYRAQRTKDFVRYRKQTDIASKKEARLTPEQIAGGRYRVARARNNTRKILSAVVGTAIGSGVASTGATAAAPVIAAASAVYFNRISGGSYYASEKRAYGNTRAKYQAKDNIRKRERESAGIKDKY